jgi:hypothetical protein
MRHEDILALAALAGGLAAFKKKADKDSAALPESKENEARLAAKRAESGKVFDEEIGDPAERRALGSKILEVNQDKYGKASPERTRQAKLRALQEEDALRGVLTDSSGMPVRSQSGRSVGSGQYKKGGAVKTKSASARADGIAKRGKTRGRVI